MDKHLPPPFQLTVGWAAANYRQRPQFVKDAAGVSYTIFPSSVLATEGTTTKILKGAREIAVRRWFSNFKEQS